MSHTKTPWRITAPSDKKAREIVGADGSTVAKLTALDLPNAVLIVEAVNAMQATSTAQVTDEQDKRDAERYRWLRNKPKSQLTDEHGIQFSFAVAEPKPNNWRVHSKRGADMDSAIDATLSASKDQA
jgi:hypothetical protein